LVFGTTMPKPATHNSQLAEKIRELRKRLDLSQSRFAIALGATVTTVSNWEREANAPSPDHYIKMGNMAPPELAGFFYRQAGIDLQHVWHALTAERARKSPAKSLNEQ